MKFTSIDRIQAKLSREIGGETLSNSDIVEWVGEALGFMKMYSLLESKVAFLNVENYQTKLPDNFKYVSEIRRHNKLMSYDNLCDDDVDEILVDDEKEPAPAHAVCVDCIGKPLNELKVRYFLPDFKLRFFYSDFYRSSMFNDFSLIHLAKSNYVHEDVLSSDVAKNLNKGCRSEYNISGDKMIFSFEKGFVILFYLADMLDDSGYPMVPDDSSAISAITYYIKWKISESKLFAGEKEFRYLAEYNEKKWLKYIKQFRNFSKMPQTIEDLNNILDITQSTLHGKLLRKKHIR